MTTPNLPLVVQEELDDKLKEIIGNEFGSMLYGAQNEFTEWLDQIKALINTQIKAALTELLKQEEVVVMPKTFTVVTDENGTTGTAEGQEFVHVIPVSAIKKAMDTV
jgi:hypothetical protein